jgi:transposase-like protein
MSTQQPLEALKKAGDMGFWLNERPRCPHCGADFDVSKNDAWRIYAEGHHDLSCPSCDLDFKVKSSVTFKFSTDESVQED